MSKPIRQCQVVGCSASLWPTGNAAPSVWGVKRFLGVTLMLYLVAALVGKILEVAGVARCGCSPDCWCKKPGLSAFRWVLPYWHR